MRRWAGWFALGLVVVAFAYLCFTVLAPWQLGKNTRTTRENNQIKASLSAVPVPLTSVLPRQDSTSPDSQWRQVTATGHYLPGMTVLARLRVIDGAPAFEVLTPFAVSDGPTVLVNRGYVRPVAVTGVPTIPDPPTGAVTVIGRLRDSETVSDKKPFTEGGFQQVYAIDTGQVATVTRTPLTRAYLQLVDNQPGGLGVLALPQLDAGPFLSYGIQWIAFGILAPIGLGYFVLSEIRTRRREADTPAAPITTEEKLADRYGRRP